jgi:tRNA A58 N-methylase Trm61
MKHLLYILIVLFVDTLSAQGNLQFNQVVTYTGTGSGSFSYTSPTWTVPAGKVWKIESASPSLANSAVTRKINVEAGGG